jgi:translation elongation factor aEF-1 beta
MGKVLLEYEIQPEDPEVKPEELLEKIKEKFKDAKDIEIKNYKIEPFAFGLSILVIDFIVPEQEGVEDFIESQLESVPGVGEISLRYFTRL